MRILFTSSLILFVMYGARAQMPVIKVLDSGKQVSIRGLSVVNDKVIWVSGNKGSVAKSVDGGLTWNWMTVPDYEKRDFRDIEAFSANTAIIMGIAEPAIILKTRDGGKSWKKVFEDSTRGMFLDAMDFSGDNGVVIGDPINDNIFMAITTDRGDTWQTYKQAAQSSYLKANEGEAFFASSGTNVQYFNNQSRFVFVSGGMVSGIYHMGRRYHLPLGKGISTGGANSIAISPDSKQAMVVGGNFNNDTACERNSILVNFQSTGIKMETPNTKPKGYRSCVIYLDNKRLLTCGTTGVDFSRDGGINWEFISPESYHVCKMAKNGKAVFLAGKNGRIAKFNIP